MNERFRNWRDVAIYGSAVLVCCGLIYWFLELWRADFRIPFIYGGGDEIPIGLWIKGLKDNAWIFYNSRVGMPVGLQMFDYPLPDGFHLLIFKLLGLTSSHFGKVLNLFYLGTFPAILLCSLYSLRRLGLGFPAAIFSSFLYTFLPYHFRRGESHLFLAAYYVVPLILLVTFRIFSDAPPFFTIAAGSSKGFRSRLRWNWGVVLICAILGSTGSGYYAFFACFLLVAAGGAAAVSRRQVVPALSATAVILLICITVGINIAPNLLYGRHEVALRLPVEAETYGLKIAQLLLPVSGHRLPIFAQIKAVYDSTALVNENETATLGLVGSAGFLFLLGWLGCRVIRFEPGWLRDPEKKLLDQAAVLNLVATLVGTVGGLGSVFAYLIQPQFRCYNRISVYIAFLSLFAVGLLLDRCLRGRLTSTRGKIVGGAAIVLLLAFGIFDQTTPAIVPDYTRAKQLFEQDHAFVHSVEALVPADSMIFQLPYVPFPESPGPNKLTSYDLGRGYLHSEKLRWSFPAMKGEAADAWQQTVSAVPVPDMLRAIVCAGFSGIYLDRFGYADNGHQMEHELSQVLGEGPSVANARLLFFGLEHYTTILRRGISDAEWQEYRDRFTPPFVVYDRGFYQEELSPGRSWRWSAGQSSLRLYNLSSRPKHVLFEMSIGCSSPGQHLLRITSPVLNKTLQVGGDGVHLREDIVVPVGSMQINFACDAPALRMPGDPRKMVFGIENPTLNETNHK